MTAKNPMHHKRRLLACISWLAVCTQAHAAPTLESSLDTRVPQALQRYSVPGAAVALIRGGKVVWTRGYGFADAAGARAITADTLFNVGSISKTATAWGVIRLVEQRKLDLDKPIDDYLHRWHIPASAFDARQVTARRLLSHTSGISQHGYGGTDPGKPVPPIEDSLNGKTGTGAVQLVATPGSGFSYSGANYMILQLAIEEISGEPFQKYMASKVFAPLGMKATRFDLPPNASLMATPFDAFAKPLPVLRYHELSAAGLVTSLRDLATLTAASLPANARRHGVLKAVALTTMQKAMPNSKWADRDPYGPNPQYGLGFTVRPYQLAEHVGIGHGGTNNGWESLIQLIPDTGDGIVIMTNSSNGSAVIADVLCAWRRSAVTGIPCRTVDAKIPLLAEYRRNGADASIALYRTLREKEAAAYDFGVPQLNSLGYQIMRTGDVAGAVKIFALNAEAYPQEWNVFDSLGEAQLKAGDKKAAAESYRRSVELNPGNENGKQVLREMGEAAR
jgi:D-alanyl-D-alanine carboxypeptidase